MEYFEIVVKITKILCLLWSLYEMHNATRLYNDGKVSEANYAMLWAILLSIGCY